MRLDTLIGFALIALSGCASTWTLTGGPQVPAAAGKVTSSVGKNGNTQLKISVKHLAKPDRVAPDGAIFVVWAVGPTADSAPQNLGALRVDEALDGTLETLTPLRDFRLSITAEAGPTVQTPSANVVFSAQILRR